MSKGSGPRPFSVSLDQFASNWDAIFKKDKKMKTGTCGCGRSPTGDCIGWHSLTESAYQVALTTWESSQKEKQGEETK